MGPNIRDLVLIENLMRQIKILEMENAELKEEITALNIENHKLRINLLKQNIELLKQQGQTMQHRESILSLNNEQLIQYARGEQLKDVFLKDDETIILSFKQVIS
jgi:regulator of replication initiation timing